MANKQTEKKNPLKRAASSVKQAISRFGHRGEHAIASEAKEPHRESDSSPSKRLGMTPATEHPRRVESDIPIDQLAGDYTPRQTNLKTSFRFDGRERERDQEFVRGAEDERWGDEDRFTNKSGDPRIGTHGRTYEPGERRAK